MTHPDPIGAGLALASLGGAKLFLLVLVVALPLILVIGAYLKRSRSR